MVFKVCIVTGDINAKQNKLKETLEQLHDYKLILLKDNNYYNLTNIKSIENDEQKSYQLSQHNQELLGVVSNMAAELEMYISPGFIYEEDDESLYRTALLFNPGGEVILKQRQLFITNKDNKVGLKMGNYIDITQTEFGNIGFIVGEDCWYPEVGRFMALEGVDLVLAINHYDKGGYWYQMSGIWSQVQQNQFFALEASNGGRDLIHGPCEISPYRTGILAPVGEKAKALSGEPDNYLASFTETEKLTDGVKQIKGYSIIWSRIDVSNLMILRKSYPLLKHLNPDLYQKNAPEGLFTLRRRELYEF